jgi:hypothetical protein
MNITKNFTVQELVPPEVYTERGDAVAQLMDVRIINVAQWLRDKLGKPITINNWNTGGQYKESGLRNFETSTGAKWSQHKYGRALDLKITDMQAEDVRKFIRLNWATLKTMGLTTIEKDTPSWVHIDCRYTGLDYLLEVPYK